MNLSRVVGPAIGGVLLPTIHASGVFVINAATYLFAVAGVLAIRPVDARLAAASMGCGGCSVGSPSRAATRWCDRCCRRSPSISFFCLPFIGLMPVIAAENLGMKVTGFEYGLLYACFGLGAASGAIAVGSVLVGYRRDRGHRCRPGAVRRDAAGLRAVAYAGTGVPGRVPGRRVLLRDGHDAVDAAAGASATTSCAAGSWRCT